MQHLIHSYLPETLIFTGILAAAYAIAALVASTRGDD